MGVVSPFGIGVDSFWKGLSAGASCADEIRSFDVSELPTRFAAPVPHNDREINELVEDQKTLKTLSRSGKFALIAAQEAGRAAKLSSEHPDPYRVGTSIGAGGLGYIDVEAKTQSLKIVLSSLDHSDHRSVDEARLWKNTLNGVHPLSSLKALSNIPTTQIAIKYNARGHCQTLTTACTSSAQSIGEAFRQIRSGVTDVMITGGSDSMINPNGVLAFSALGVLSRNNLEYSTASRPFDRRRDGFMLGEGGAIFILEELGSARRRNSEPLAEVVGYASTCDAYRLTDEPPDAYGSVKAMASAIEDADLRPSDIDYINAHGTGTVMNDKTETLAIKTVFGGMSTSVRVSSTKSMIGHLVAAAGAVELAACVLALKHRCVPPTINYIEPDPECDLNYVPNKAQAVPIRVVLSNSFGFGGQNACLVIKQIE